MQKLLKLPISPFTLMLVASCLAVALSLFAEFVLQQPPCFLCLVQRGLYCLLAGVALMRRSWCAFFVLLISCAVAAYHSLVQFNVLKDRCAAKVQIEDIASYREFLAANKMPSCAETWRVGFMPVSLLNGLYSLTLLGILWRKDHLFRASNFATIFFISSELK